MQWARVFERRLFADEFFLPTVLMHSAAHRRLLVNHHLRHERWPTGNISHREAYWAALHESEWGGAQLLDSKQLTAAMRSPMLFAKKLVPSVDPAVVPRSAHEVVATASAITRTHAHAQRTTHSACAIERGGASPRHLGRSPLRTSCELSDPDRRARWQIRRMASAQAARRGRPASTAHCRAPIAH